MKKNITRISKALFVSSLLFATSATLADVKELSENDVQQISINLANQTLQGGYKLMSISQLKQTIDSKEDFVLIDAHPKKEFVAGYIAGATNFGFQSNRSGVWNKDVDIEGGATQEQYKTVLGEDLNKKIVVYCGFTKCGRSHNAAWWAKFMGYTNVYRAPGGITGWKDAGHPYKTVN